MIEFETLRTTCEKISSISKNVIDEFLLYYAATVYKLDHPMTVSFSTYNHVTKEFEKEWINRLKAQYLAHKIFQSGGLIRKIITHTEIRKFSKPEMDFLEGQATQPWRFCFSIIIENPTKDFYIMEDILTGEKFTLYSPGTSETIKTQSTSLFFNLITYNGACWQTYGPIVAYKSFELDDIFFFATELDPTIESEEDIIQDLEKNPLPYMMLLSGANYPFTAHKKDQIVQVYAEYPVDKFDTPVLNKSFTSEFSHGVYRLSLKGWDEHPHFAIIYYDENKETVLISANTDRGFQALVQAINKYAYKFSIEPDIRVNMSMLITAKKILKKEILLNEYDQLFNVDTKPEDKAIVDNLNVFMSLILPEINAGQTPDIEKHAAKAGIDAETARDIVNNLINKFGKP